MEDLTNTCHRSVVDAFKFSIKFSHTRTVHVFIGNILCLAGFGNLQGNLEFWDLSQKKLISSVSAKDATCFMWAPDGAHALTATLSPRMRVGNG